MARKILIDTGVTTVGGTLASYDIPANATHLAVVCDKASAVGLRLLIKDGNVNKSDVTASTGRRLNAGEATYEPPGQGTLQVIGEGGTATYSVYVLVD